MTTDTMTVLVLADADADGCLAAAAAEFIEAHPTLAGLDLDPQWADDECEVVALTVPVSLTEVAVREAARARSEGWAERTSDTVRWTGDVPDRDLDYLEQEILGRQATMREIVDFCREFASNYNTIMEQREERGDF